MVIRSERIELILIGVALFVAFFYLLLRAIVLDSFIWILAVPVLASLYLLMVPRRYLLIRPNLLDWFVIAYVLYGTTMGGIGVLFLAANKVVVVTVIVHYVAPLVFYFIARRYTRHSMANAMNLTKLVWVLAALFLVDFFLELYVVRVLESGLSIPWVRDSLNSFSAVTPQLLQEFNSDRITTFIVGGKRPGFVAVMFLALTLPFAYVERARITALWAHRAWHPKLLYVMGLVVALGYASFQLGNETAVVAACVVVVMGMASVRSPRRILLMAAGFGVALFFAYGSLANIARGQVLTVRPDLGEYGLTPFEYLTSPSRIAATYTNADPYAVIYGAFVTGQNTGGRPDVSPGSLSSTELRAVAYPIFFGIGWALIVVAAFVVMVWYSLLLTKSPQLRLFGLIVAGLLVVYGSDLHYPTTITHGPIELFVVMAGGLSSMHEILRRQRDAPEERAGDGLITTADATP